MLSRRTRWSAAALLLTAILAAGWLVRDWWRGRPEQAADRSALPSGSAPLSDDSRRELLVGVWEDDYQGRRTMTLRPDGTGEMLVELEGLSARLFAERLRFDMEWSLNDGRLTKRTLGGEPAAKVKLILSTMGDRVDEPILELNDSRLLLLDADGQTRYDWRRVGPLPPSEPKP